jgi:putative addiction module killer protein
MIVRQTEEFIDWLARLSDARARAKIAMRLTRASRGNLGDVKAVAKVSRRCGSTTGQAIGCTSSEGARC